MRSWVLGTLEVMFEGAQRLGAQRFGGHLKDIFWGEGSY